MAQDFDLAELERIDGSLETVTLRPGEFLFIEDDEGDALYLVKRGTLRVIRGDTVYETLRAGSIVGEMAIIDEQRRSASVIAGTHAELLKLDEAKFLELIASAPRFALTVMRVMSRRLRVMNERYRQSASAVHSRPLATAAPASPGSDRNSGTR